MFNSHQLIQNEFNIILRFKLLCINISGRGAVVNVTKIRGLCSIYRLTKIVSPRKFFKWSFLQLAFRILYNS